MNLRRHLLIAYCTSNIHYVCHFVSKRVISLSSFELRPWFFAIIFACYLPNSPILVLRDSCMSRTYNFLIISVRIFCIQLSFDQQLLLFCCLRNFIFIMQFSYDSMNSLNCIQHRCKPKRPCLCFATGLDGFNFSISLNPSCSFLSYSISL